MKNQDGNSRTIRKKYFKKTIYLQKKSILQYSDDSEQKIAN